MAIPSVTPFASWDKASGTQGLSIDQKLWAALSAKHPILDMLERPSVDEVKFSWETDVMPTRVYTGMDVATNPWDSATATALKLNACGSAIPVGSILRNVTRATPVTSATLPSRPSKIAAISTNQAASR